ncbi:MAG: extracellular solute-binding protein [Spirochaetaceae bacterium]|jgi:multiple sugar transport system substrate-binding protein|nr:extracellular solute-binding protein [Spirochaetaceae bacterium]
MKKSFMRFGLAALCFAVITAGVFAGGKGESGGGTAAAPQTNLPLVGSGALQYNPNTPVNDGKNLTLNFWWPNEGPEGYERWARAVADYQKIHPNVKIEINNSLGWGDYWTRLPVAVASGTGPDLMHFHLAYYTQFIPGLAEPFPVDLTNAILSDYNGVEPFMYEGKLYTIPVGNMTGTMFYNKALWAQAGLTDKDIPKTWDELRVVAKKLTKTDNSGRNTVNGFELPDGWFLLALNYQKGYNVFAEDGKHTRLNNPGAIEAAKMVQDWVSVDKISAAGSGAPQERFGNQQSALMYGWTWIGAWLEGNVGNRFEWGVFPTPTFPGTQVVDRNNPEVSAVVNANSPADKKAVALDFLKFYFSSDQYLVELGNKAYVVPTKKSAAGDASLASNKVMKEVIKYVDKTIWTGITSTGFEDLLARILTDEIMLQNRPAQESLRKFDEGNNQYVGDMIVPTAERKSALARYLK